MARYEHIQFEFLRAGYADEASGTVLLRSQEMILEVDDPGDLPYSIRGKMTGDFFSGRHEGEPAALRVTAKWIRLDDIFVGTWVEDGVDGFLHSDCRRMPMSTLRLVGAGNSDTPRPRRKSSSVTGCREWSPRL